MWILIKIGILTQDFWAQSLVGFTEKTWNLKLLSIMDQFDQGLESKIWSLKFSRMFQHVPQLKWIKMVSNDTG